MTYNIQPMLNVYPDSIGGRLKGTIDLLNQSSVKGAFQAIYLLPSLYHTDLDRGFSVIDYDLNKVLVGPDDLDQLANAGIKTKLDFILNHASVLSPQFQSILDQGSQSPYYDFFIDWNHFWQGHGVMTPQGYIEPAPELIKDMFFRKPGLPILQVTAQTGEKLTFWNTFYQDIQYPSMTVQDWMKALDCQYPEAEIIQAKVADHLSTGQDLQNLDLGELAHWLNPVLDTLSKKAQYLGQMDLNLQSDLVWDFYGQTLDKLASYGASIVRLDAFAYGPKAVGRRNFLNDPETWDLLAKIQTMAEERGLTLLPEIHEAYELKIHEKIAQQGYLTYDFFLPGLVLATLENHDASQLFKWIGELKTQGMQTVNMLGCHDGIPLLDLKGLLSETQIKSLIDLVVSRGGYVKNLHGQENVYYQVNATYYSALGEDPYKLLAARALQIFTPGKPQVWYLDLFAGTNDYQAVEKAGAGGHKEINRTNLDWQFVEDKLSDPLVQDQLTLLKFRADFAAFDPAAVVTTHQVDQTIGIQWDHQGYQARMTLDLKAPSSLKVTGLDPNGHLAFTYSPGILN